MRGKLKIPFKRQLLLCSAEKVSGLRFLRFPLKSGLIVVQCAVSVEATVSFKEQGDCCAVRWKCQGYCFF